jgi:hypothetical protein
MPEKPTPLPTDPRHPPPLTPRDPTQLPADPVTPSHPIVEDLDRDRPGRDDPARPHPTK